MCICMYVYVYIYIYISPSLSLSHPLSVSDAVAGFCTLKRIATARDRVGSG